MLRRVVAERLVEIDRSDHVRAERRRGVGPRLLRVRLGSQMEDPFRANRLHDLRDPGRVLHVELLPRHPGVRDAARRQFVGGKVRSDDLVAVRDGETDQVPADEPRRSRDQ